VIEEYINMMLYFVASLKFATKSTNCVPVIGVNEQFA